MDGYMQLPGHVQVISNVVDYDLPLQAALDQTRWEYWEICELGIEPHPDGDIAFKLVLRGHNVRTFIPQMFGSPKSFARTSTCIRPQPNPEKTATSRDTQAMEYVDARL